MPGFELFGLEERQEVMDVLELLAGPVPARHTRLFAARPLAALVAAAHRPLPPPS